MLRFTLKNWGFFAHIQITYISGKKHPNCVIQYIT